MSSFPDSFIPLLCLESRVSRPTRKSRLCRAFPVGLQSVAEDRVPVLGDPVFGQHFEKQHTSFPLRQPIQDAGENLALRLPTLFFLRGKCLHRQSPLFPGRDTCPTVILPPRGTAR